MQTQSALATADIYAFYESMVRNNILLSFKGDLSSELLESLLQIMEGKMEKLQEEPKMRKKVFNVLVECLQNLYHHSDDEASRSVLLMIGKEKEFYLISTGNYILKDKVEPLQKRIDEINAMNKDELKNHYQNALNTNEFSAKGGGGLGMIDIARKSGQKLIYEFKPINDKHSFFSLQIRIAL